jgi:hypothetical protein
MDPQTIKWIATRTRAAIHTVQTTFDEHPKSKNETYWQHLCGTGWTGSVIVVYGLGTLVNAVFPFWYQYNDQALHERLSAALDNIQSTSLSKEIS